MAAYAFVAVDVNILNFCLEFSISNIGIEIDDSASVKVVRKGLKPAATYENLKILGCSIPSFAHVNLHLIILLLIL